MHILDCSQDLLVSLRQVSVLDEVNERMGYSALARDLRTPWRPALAISHSYMSIQCPVMELRFLRLPTALMLMYVPITAHGALLRSAEAMSMVLSCPWTLVLTQLR